MSSNTSRRDGNLPSSSYGIKEIDLSKDRSSEEEYELIRAPSARSIAFLQVPDECYFHFGDQTSPGLDLRDFEGGILERPPFVKEPFGVIYLSNPASSSGTLRIFFGADIQTTPEITVDAIQEIQNISDSIDVTSRSGRNIGKARLMDSGGSLIDGTNPFPVEQQSPVEVGAYSGTTLPTEQQSPVGIEDSTGTQIDPLVAGDFPLGVEASSSEGTKTATATTAGNTASVTHTEGPVEIVADTSGSATLTVEVSHDGGTTWTSYAVSIGSSDGIKETVHGFDDVRASVNQNLNRLTLSAKGVGG